jgi:hypothetical protein
MVMICLVYNMVMMVTVIMVIISLELGGLGSQLVKAYN